MQMVVWFLCGAVAFGLMNFGANAEETSSVSTPLVLDATNLSEWQPSEGDLFAQAIDWQKQKDYSRALQLFTDLLRFYPESKTTEETLHRMAECYRALGRFDEAKETLKLNREKFPQGTWLDAGYLLEGEMLAADGKWKEAIAPLERVANAKEAAVQLRSFYLIALARENLNELVQARPQLEKLVEAKKDYSDFACVKLGAIEAEAEHSEEAEKLFKKALEQTKDPAVKAEAADRAGNLAYSLKKYKEAVDFFEKARSEDVPQFWKELAHLGLVQSFFALGDYKAVVKTFNNVKPRFPAQARAQAFFLAAESYRLLKENQEALAQYDLILKEFSKDAVAEPSAWARLLLLQETNSPLFLLETEAFPAAFPKSPHLAFVEMMRADVFFKEGKFDVCAPLYEKLNGDKTVQSAEEAIRAAVLFRWGSSVFALHQFEKAERVFNDFLQKFPKHEQAANALWMQAQSYQALKKTSEARGALDRLLKEYPSFKERETALWQAALLAGDQKDNVAMKKRLEELLKDFPQTQWAADAHHWLAFCFSQEKRDDLAKEHWEKARLLDPKTYAGIAMQQLIRIALQEKNLVALMAEVEKYDQWLAERSKLPDKENKPMPAISPDVIEWIAQELAASDDPARAEKYYRRVLAQSTDPAQQRRAQIGFATLFSKLHQWKEAAREWETFRSRFPDESNHNTVLESLAEAYINLGKLDEAERLANQLLRQSPEGVHNARGRMLLGEVEFARKNYDEASKIFSAVALLIEDPEITPHARVRAEEARKLAGPQRPRQPAGNPTLP